MTDIFRPSFHVFRRVITDNTVWLTLTRGHGQDERILKGTRAINGLKALQEIQITEFPAEDRIVPYSWDYEQGVTPDNLTPSAWYAYVREEGPLYHHHTNLGVFEVGDPHYYDCYHAEGGSRIPGSWHYNIVRVRRTEVDAVFERLLGETFAPTVMDGLEELAGALKTLVAALKGTVK
jgi:hypothetical protein